MLDILLHQKLMLVILELVCSDRFIVHVCCIPVIRNQKCTEVANILSRAFSLFIYQKCK